MFQNGNTIFPTRLYVEQKTDTSNESHYIIVFCSFHFYQQKTIALFQIFAINDLVYAHYFESVNIYEPIHNIYEPNAIKHNQYFDIFTKIDTKNFSSITGQKLSSRLSLYFVTKTPSHIRRKLLMHKNGNESNYSRFYSTIQKNPQGHFEWEPSFQNVVLQCLILVVMMFIFFAIIIAMMWLCSMYVLKRLKRQKNAFQSNLCLDITEF